MKYSSMMTSKGQVTIPVEIRRQLGLRPGLTVSFSISGNVVQIEQPDWRRELGLLQLQVREHMKRRGLKPLSDESLRSARLQAQDEMAAYRLKRMQDSL